MCSASQPENWGTTVSIEVDKTNPGLHSRSWLCYYEVLHEIWIQTKEEAIYNRVGHLPKNVALCGFLCHLTFLVDLLLVGQMMCE